MHASKEEEVVAAGEVEEKGKEWTTTATDGSRLLRLLLLLLLLLLVVDFFDDDEVDDDGANAEIEDDDSDGDDGVCLAPKSAPLIDPKPLHGRTRESLDNGCRVQRRIAVRIIAFVGVFFVLLEIQKTRKKNKRFLSLRFAQNF